MVWLESVKLKELSDGRLQRVSGLVVMAQPNSIERGNCGKIPFRQRIRSEDLCIHTSSKR
jgi:hypothetical protein